MQNFTKYTVNGNRFIIINLEGINKQKEFEIINEYFLYLRNNELVKNIDGIIFIFQNKDNNYWRFFNNDYLEADMCANGASAVIKFLYEDKRINKEEIFAFNTNVFKVFGKVKQNLNTEILLPEPIIKQENINFNGYKWTLIDAGVPHIITYVKDINEFNLELCEIVRNKFDANVSFCEVKENIVYIRTYERGVEAETNSCGTGIISSGYFIINQKNLKEIYLLPKGGELTKVKLNKDKGVCYTTSVEKIL